MHIRGRFLFHFPGRSCPIIIPNTIPNEGELSFLKMIARADVTDVSAGGNFYIGLMDQAPTETDTLAALTTEPAVANGYARKAIARDATGWPTLTTVNGVQVIRTSTVTFLAAGGTIGPFSRAFLCNVASGTAGLLLALSGALTAAVTLLDTNSFAMQYELLLD